MMLRNYDRWPRANKIALPIQWNSQTYRNVTPTKPSFLASGRFHGKRGMRQIYRGMGMLRDTSRARTSKKPLESRRVRSVSKSRAAEIGRSKVGQKRIVKQR